jgi:fructokinase
LQSAPIWVAGEALIDLLPGGVPVVGGGPANTAKALSNLGLDTQFIGGISSDEFGLLIEKELHSYGVGLELALRSGLPTAVAEVSLDSSGVANYEFRLLETATFSFGDWLPSGEPSILHVGTLGTIVDPGASKLFDWAKNLDCLIVYDPNVRSAVLSNKDRYREYFSKWAQISSVIKLSEEDLNYLGYTVEEILQFGVELVVVTHGERGLRGFNRGEEIFAPGVKVEVVDTIGAGDTVGAILVEGLLKNGSLQGELLESTLKRAARAAAITCKRAGAIPPSFEELSK